MVPETLPPTASGVILVWSVPVEARTLFARLTSGTCPPLSVSTITG
jgi:hypothetical protein